MKVHERSNLFPVGSQVFVEHRGDLKKGRRGEIVKIRVDFGWPQATRNRRRAVLFDDGLTGYYFVSELRPVSAVDQLAELGRTEL